MKTKLILLAGALAFLSVNGRADGTNSVAAAKPDLLATCPVSGDRIGGDMGKPYIFIYQGQEVKLCCSMCKAEFDKNPQKYLTKIQAAAVVKNK